MQTEKMENIERIGQEEETVCIMDPNICWQGHTLTMCARSMLKDPKS